ncbi:hypothetical protein EDB84DRAFT_171934 [Lactarius hengduanensis]|nr:hypothetical protein EDB84DRAFT_171934 [Lactarius hengduanensis]
MSIWPFCRQNPAVLLLMFATIDNCIAWKPVQAAKPEDAYVWRDSIMMLEGFCDATDDLGYAAFRMISRGGGRGGDREGIRRGGQQGELELDNFAEHMVRVNRGFTEIEMHPLPVSGYMGPQRLTLIITLRPTRSNCKNRYNEFCLHFSHTRPCLCKRHGYFSL